MYFFILGDGAAPRLRRTAAVRARRATAASRPAALGAGDPAFAAYALQSTAASRHVPGPVPGVHSAHEHTRVCARDTAPDRQGKGRYFKFNFYYFPSQTHCFEYT